MISIRLPLVALCMLLTIGPDALSAAPQSPIIASTQPARNDNALPSGSDPLLRELSFDGVGFNDTIDFLRDVTRENFYLDWKEIEAVGIDRNAPITAKRKNVHLSKMLDEVLEGASAGGSKLAWSFEDGVIVISSPQEIARLNALGAERLQRELHGGQDKSLMVRIAAIKADGVGLADVFNSLATQGGVQFDIDWKQIEEEGVDRNAPITMNLQEVTLGHALDLLLSQAGMNVVKLEYSVEAPGKIAIKLKTAKKN